MTAATYTFTLSAAQSSAVSMVVELQPDTTSSTPGTDGRWQGGTRPRITLNWASNALTAQGTVNTAPNSTVDGNAVYKWVKISSTPSDLALDTSALPTVTIIDDDTSGGGNTTVYGPENTTDSGVVAVGGTNMRMECVWKNQTNAGSFMLGLDANGNGVALHQINDTNWQLRRVVAGDRGSDGQADDPKALPGSAVNGLPVTDGQTLAVQIINGAMTIFKGSTQLSFGSGASYDVSQYVGGTNARYKGWIGPALTGLKIIRLA